jgi:hypothetical protein
MTRTPVSQRSITALPLRLPLPGKPSPSDMLAAAAIAVGAGEIDWHAGIGETMDERNANAAGCVKQTAIEGDGRASRTCRRRRIGGCGRRGNAAFDHLDLTGEIGELTVILVRSVIRPASGLVARLPFASEVTSWVGPLCAALLEADVMPAIV